MMMIFFPRKETSSPVSLPPPWVLLESIRNTEIPGQWDLIYKFTRRGKRLWMKWKWGLYIKENNTWLLFTNIFILKNFPYHFLCHHRKVKSLSKNIEPKNHEKSVYLNQYHSNFFTLWNYSYSGEFYSTHHFPTYSERRGKTFMLLGLGWNFLEYIGLSILSLLIYHTPNSYVYSVAF